MSDNNSIGLGLVTKEDNHVSLDRLKGLFPKKKATITDLTVDLINNTMNDPEFNGHSLIDTLTTYESVMYKNKGNMIDYINAVKFCGYLEGCGDSSVGAYIKTFSAREFVSSKKDFPTDSPEYKALTAASTRYRQSPMVVDILTQADVPLYLLFQGFRHKAVTVLAREMSSAPHAKDRISAADKLLTHVKPPENVQIELDIGVSQVSVIEEYEKAIEQMAQAKLKGINEGENMVDMINAPVRVKTVEADVIEADVYVEDFNPAVHDCEVYEKYGIIVEVKR